MRTLGNANRHILIIQDKKAEELPTVLYAIRGEERVSFRRYEIDWAQYGEFIGEVTLKEVFGDNMESRVKYFFVIAERGDPTDLSEHIYHQHIYIQENEGMGEIKFMGTDIMIYIVGNFVMDLKSGEDLPYSCVRFFTEATLEPRSEDTIQSTIDDCGFYDV